jgi:ribosome maturation factor RimP
MKMNSLDESIKKIVETEGVSLYDIERTKEGEHNYFRVYITGENINLKVCEKLSKVISPLLDVEEPMNGKYFFEVSSPGLERHLKKIEHFKASIGERVNIKSYEGKFKGTIKSIDGNNITVDCDGEEKIVALEDIKSAKTYIVW